MSEPDHDLDERLQEYVKAAAQSAPGPPVRDPVNRPMIHHWCDAIGDTNPIYVDEELAAQSVERAGAGRHSFRHFSLRPTPRSGKHNPQHPLQGLTEGIDPTRHHHAPPRWRGLNQKTRKSISATTSSF